MCWLACWIADFAESAVIRLGTSPHRMVLMMSSPSAAAAASSP
eukprot:CAMPEP_0173405514 /NCGR_PEP_ID=MMETSP1356-20130122/61979_1 /TAXON_ID=77927 ORGANISM="Hemiselmis virescens, Strain PCC157" /NCGR_SAMPLE_ID=MMETSP1356 /ASSEMBLY_ACC=CAM_ASM_000847 /LENGTH=42 /DNA_ID= /DNA_START= /DNA_END= /DNA_ORIENTATION=